MTKTSKHPNSVAIKLVGTLMLILCFLMIFKADAYAATVLEKKTEKNITWTMYDDGTLKISKAKTPNDKGYTFDNYRLRINNVIIENGVTAIPDYAFNSFFNLTDITIPGTVKSIGFEAFSHCYSLDNVVVPDSVVKIGKSAFRDCHNLTNIRLSKAIKSIENQTFLNCEYLTSITIPNKVTYIGDDAFRDCRNLEKAVLPDSLKTIGAAAFRNCSSLTSIIVPSSVTSFGERHNDDDSSMSSYYEAGYVFANCRKLSSIKISKSLTNDENNFLYTAWNLNRKGTIKVAEKTLSDYTSILDKNGTLTVTGNGYLNFNNDIFRNNHLVKKLVISEGITRIDLWEIFCDSEYFQNMTTVVNKSKATVKLTHGFHRVLRYDDQYSWYDCNGTLEPITQIGKGTAVRVSDSERFLLKLKFNSNGSTSGNMKDLSDDIGDTIVIPKVKFKKKGYVFSHFSYKIGKTTYTAEPGDAISLSRKDVKYKDLKNNCFTITLKANWIKDKKIAAVGTELKDKNGKKTGYVVTSDKENNLTVKFVGTSADRKAKTLTIKNTVKDTNGNIYKVTAIGSCAFRDCEALTTLTIPSNVKSIEEGAFEDCEKLRTIKINAGSNALTKIGKWAFDDIDDNATFTITASDKNVYNKTVKKLKVNKVTSKDSKIKFTWRKIKA